MLSIGEKLDLDKCAEGRNRTGMKLPSPVFETGASTNSATPAVERESIAVFGIRSILGEKSFIIEVSPYENNAMLYLIWGLILLLFSPLSLAAAGAATPLNPVLVDPNVVYLLILIAIYGLFFEIANPGFILPGVLGIISLLFVLYAFQFLPINYLGLLLLAIGVGLMMFEVYASSYGLVGIAGIILFLIGSIMLYDSQDPNYQLAWWLIILMSLLSFLFFFMIANLAIKSHKRAVITGKEGIIGSEGVVLSVMNEQVIVRVLGEIWEARSNVMLERDQRIKVTAIKGLQLLVEPIADAKHKAGEK